LESRGNYVKIMGERLCAYLKFVALKFAHIW